MDDMVGTQKTHPQLIQNARGEGTFCAMDSPNAKIRDELIVSLRNRGEDLIHLNIIIIIIIIIYILQVFILEGVGTIASGSGQHLFLNHLTLNCSWTALRRC